MAYFQSGVKITSTLEDQMKICCSLVRSHKEKSARPLAKETVNVSFSCGVDQILGGSTVVG